MTWHARKIPDRWPIAAIAAAAVVMTMMLTGLSQGLAQASDQQPNRRPRADVVSVLDRVELSYDAEMTEPVERDGITHLHLGQAAETTIELPRLPRDQASLRKLMARVYVEPIETETEEGLLAPGDRWSRTGSLHLVKPGAVPPAPVGPGEEPADDDIELLRFVTGYGGEGTFEADLTPLLPLLQGRCTLRAYISTYLSPAWLVSVELEWSDEPIGYRRPVFAAPLFTDHAVDATRSKVSASVTIPAGISRPRLRLFSTGHATDGNFGDEFTPRTNIVRIDGREVARFRPWAENGARLRRHNPFSGRKTVQGRQLWSSDIDRAGWHPGSIVEPIIIPLPELTPGEHTVEVEVLNIRPRDESDQHGYWRISGIVIADEPWPILEREPDRIDH